MPYNPRYTATCQPILKIANWDVLTADIEKKFIAVFSWMPQTIMAVKHDGKRFKWEVHSAESMRSALEPVQARFSTIQKEHLRNFPISRSGTLIGDLFEALLPDGKALHRLQIYAFLGAPTAADVGQHDPQTRRLRCERNGYVRFIAGFQRQITVSQRIIKRRSANVLTMQCAAGTWYVWRNGNEYCEAVSGIRPALQASVDIN